MKILIISGKEHTQIGGGETYNRHLILTLLRKQYEIIEMPCLISEQKDSISNKSICKINWTFAKLWSGSFISKIKSLFFLHQYSKKFDIIINSSGFSFFNLNKRKNAIFVVHTREKNYSILFKLKHTICYWFVVFNWILSFIHISFFNPISKCKTVITQVNNENVSKGVHKILIPRSLDINTDKNLVINFKDKKHIIYIGRYISHVKGLDFLVEIQEKINHNIHCYGSGPDNALIDKNFVNHGIVQSHDVINVIKKSKIVLLPSRWEGSPFIRVLAYSVGVPVIFFDSFQLPEKKVTIDLDIIPSFNINFFSNRVSKIMKMNEQEYINNSRKYISLVEEITSDVKTFDKKWINIIKNN